MLSFAVFDGPTPAQNRVLRHAYLVGPDNVPVAGEVEFNNGLVRCLKTSSEAAGLAMQVKLDGQTLSEINAVGHEPPLALRSLGVITLQTCLLPERDEPYLLSLELARHRIMLFLNKLEEWQLFDFPPDHPVMRLFEDARQTFTEALVAQRHHGADAPAEHFGFNADAHRLSLKALWLAVEAAERLALIETEQQFAPRMTGQIWSEAQGEGAPAPAKGSAPAIHPTRPGIVLSQRPALGCAISPGVFGMLAQSAAAESCDFVTMPMRWVELEPSEGEYTFAPTDRWIEWAVRKARLPIVGGPVIDFRPSCVPEWLYIWENDYETLRELVYEHVKAVVTRYRRTVARWTICSGLHANTHFKLSFDQMMDLTRICVLVMRKLHPQGKVQVEISQPWGEYYTANRKSLPPMLYADMMAQAGIHVDSIALRVQMGQPEPGQSVRDLMAFSAMLDQYATLDKPISLTAVGAPAAETPPPHDEPERNAGWWREPWSESSQADWLSSVCSVAAAKPYVHSICWQELVDPPRVAEMPAGGLISSKGERRPAFERFVEVRNAVMAAQPIGRLHGVDLLGETDHETQAVG